MKSPTVPEPFHPVRQLVRTFGLLERVMRPYFARFGISGSQWGVLRNLRRAEEDGVEGLRLTELSERLLIKPASVTGLIDRLERAGLVERFSSPTDLRVTKVQLTSEGRDIVERILNVHPEKLADLMTGLSGPEQKELSRLLARWCQNLEKSLHSGVLEPASVG
ncbi:MAG: MarR family transcriptional regulator [Gemmataceae bacterium]